MDTVIKEVEEQLLSSSLSDSMMHGTGLPINIPDTKIKESRISGSAVLVEIVSITDIGASAFSLNKVRLAREERLAAGESEEGEGDVEVDGEGPVPNYPRSMLSFEISDGAVTLKAMEYRSLPQMKLGATPLGYKVRCHRIPSPPSLHARSYFSRTVEYGVASPCSSQIVLPSRTI